jgi:hypothetical protein
VVSLTPGPFYGLVKSALYRLNRRLYELLARSASLGEKKCLSPLSAIELPLCGFPSTGLLTMPIELFMIVLCSGVK